MFIYVMRSSRMSLKSKKKIISCLLVFSIGVVFKLKSGENPMEIEQLVQKIWTVEGLQNNRKQKNLSALFDFILISVFASSDSFCLITSHICNCIIDNLYLYVNLYLLFIHNIVAHRPNMWLQMHNDDRIKFKNAD